MSDERLQYIGEVAINYDLKWGLAFEVIDEAKRARSAEAKQAEFIGRLLDIVEEGTSDSVGYCRWCGLPGWKRHADDCGLAMLLREGGRDA